MIDPVIHAPARLAIVTTLATLAKGDALRFPALQSITELTAGNLTTHVRKLEDAGYVVVRTSGRGRASSTTIALTPSGRSAFAAYRAELLRLLEGDLSGHSPFPPSLPSAPPASATASSPPSSGRRSCSPGPPSPQRSSPSPAGTGRRSGRSPWPPSPR